MYVNNFPCADCTRAIIQSGIVQLNSFAPDMKDANFARQYKVAETMLRESNVDVRLFDREDAFLIDARKRLSVKILGSASSQLR